MLKNLPSIPDAQIPGIEIRECRPQHWDACTKLRHIIYGFVA